MYIYTPTYSVAVFPDLSLVSILSLFFKLKGNYTQTWKLTNYLLTTLQTEGWVKCLSPQNIFEVSGVTTVLPLHQHSGE